MKKIASIFLLLISFGFSISATAQAKQEWKEMHAFHAIMSKTFHPSESNNMQPLKDSSSILLAAAKAWQQSRVPDGYNAKVTAPILISLVSKCNEIEQAVKQNKSNIKLKKLIAEAHDIFHEIMEKCTKE